MNSYEDLIRRVHFMVRELVRKGHNPDDYHMVLSNRLFLDVMHAMPAANRADYSSTPGKLLGFPIAFADHSYGIYYLALRHEVQG